MLLVNGEIGIIEQFYELSSIQYAVIRLLKIIPFNFNIPRVPQDLSSALLKVNECFLFCNLLDNRIMINISQIKEKILLIESKINPKASFFVSRIVVKHN